MACGFEKLPTGGGSPSGAAGIAEVRVRLGALGGTRTGAGFADDSWIGAEGPGGTTGSAAGAARSDIEALASAGPDSGFGRISARLASGRPWRSQQA